VSPPVSRARTPSVSGWVEGAIPPPVSGGRRNTAGVPSPLPVTDAAAEQTTPPTTPAAPLATPHSLLASAHTNTPATPDSTRGGQLVGSTNGGGNTGGGNTLGGTTGGGATRGGNTGGGTTGGGNTGRGNTGGGTTGGSTTGGGATGGGTTGGGTTRGSTSPDVNSLRRSCRLAVESILRRGWRSAAREAGALALLSLATRAESRSATEAAAVREALVLGWLPTGESIAAEARLTLSTAAEAVDGMWSISQGTATERGPQGPHKAAHTEGRGTHTGNTQIPFGGGMGIRDGAGGGGGGGGADAASAEVSLRGGVDPPSPTTTAFTSTASTPPRATRGTRADSDASNETTASALASGISTPPHNFGGGASTPNTAGESPPLNTAGGSSPLNTAGASPLNTAGGSSPLNTAGGASPPNTAGGSPPLNTAGGASPLFRLVELSGCPALRTARAGVAALRALSKVSSLPPHPPTHVYSFLFPSRTRD